MCRRRQEENLSGWSIKRNADGEEVADYPLGQNVVLKPGAKLKVKLNPFRYFLHCGLQIVQTRVGHRSIFADQIQANPICMFTTYVQSSP